MKTLLLKRLMVRSLVRTEPLPARAFPPVQVMEVAVRLSVPWRVPPLALKRVRMGMAAGAKETMPPLMVEELEALKELLALKVAEVPLKVALTVETPVLALKLSAPLRLTAGPVT